MTITLEQTAEIHHTMDHRVYRIGLHLVTAQLSGQNMTGLLLNHQEQALMNDTVTTLMWSKEEICELVVAEDSRSAIMSFQVTSAIHGLFYQLLPISWTSWPRPQLSQQAAAANSSPQQHNMHLKHTSPEGAEANLCYSLKEVKPTSFF